MDLSEWQESNKKYSKRANPERKSQSNGDFDEQDSEQLKKYYVIADERQQENQIDENQQSPEIAAKDSSQQDSDQQDDLALFAQQKRIQVFKQNNLNPNIYDNEDQIENKQKNNSAVDFKKFYGHHQGEKRQEEQKSAKKQKPEVDQEMNEAKRLRSYNAAKYFERIKLCYMRKVYNRANEVNQISSKKHQLYQLFDDQFCVFLSILPAELVKECYLLRNKSPFTINEREVLAIFKKAFKNKLLNEFEKSVGPHERPMTKVQLIFKLSQFLNCQIRKIDFFSLSHFVDQAFYNLNFEKDVHDRKKGKKNKTSLEDKIKHKIQKVLFQQQLEESQDFVDLNNFSFDSVNKSMSMSDHEMNKQLKEIKRKSRRNQEIKKNFVDEIYQIFSHREQKWVMFVAIEDHFDEIQTDWFKTDVLHGQPIIGFYSVEFLKPVEKYESLLDFRKTDNILIQDMSMYFCDNWKRLNMRKKRVGVKPLMAKLFRLYHFLKPYDILENPQAFQLQHSVQQARKILVQSQLPKTKEQFNLSDYFLTKSRVGKYHILSPTAKPVSEQIEFNEEKIYWKDDLIPVCSRMGWIDSNRMVREGAQPLKKTQNKNKKPIELYRYQQTKPYVLPIDPEGNFILDPQHNSIYVPPKLNLPQGTCVIPQKVTYICNKYKIRFAKLVQGFVHTAGMRVLPNEIGYLIYEEDREFVLKMYHERMELLNKNKEQRYDEKLEKMWKDVLKYVKLIDRMGGELKN